MILLFGRNPIQIVCTERFLWRFSPLRIAQCLKAWYLLSSRCIKAPLVSNFPRLHPGLHSGSPSTLKGRHDTLMQTKCMAHWGTNRVNMFCMTLPLVPLSTKLWKLLLCCLLTSTHHVPKGRFKGQRVGTPTATVGVELGQVLNPIYRAGGGLRTA